MICAICCSCEPNVLVGKTVFSGDTDCTAALSVFAYEYALLVMELSACTRVNPESNVSSVCAVASCAPHSVVPSEHWAPPRFPGLTLTGVLALPLQNRVSPATDVIIGTEAPLLYAAVN